MICLGLLFMQASLCSEIVINSFRRGCKWQLWTYLDTQDHLCSSTQPSLITFLPVWDFTTYSSTYLHSRGFFPPCFATKHEGKKLKGLAWCFHSDKLLQYSPASTKGEKGKGKRGREERQGRGLSLVTCSCALMFVLMA